MTASQQQTPGQREDEFLRNHLPHLAACVTIGALVILVILAIHWLT
jgi:hypothetical protein